jgi:hypothetical protein
MAVIKIHPRIRAKKRKTKMKLDGGRRHRRNTKQLFFGKLLSRLQLELRAWGMGDYSHYRNGFEFQEDAPVGPLQVEDGPFGWDWTTLGSLSLATGMHPLDLWKRFYHMNDWGGMYAWGGWDPSYAAILVSYEGHFYHPECAAYSTDYWWDIEDGTLYVPANWARAVLKILLRGGTYAATVPIQQGQRLSEGYVQKSLDYAFYPMDRLGNILFTTALTQRLPI